MSNAPFVIATLAIAVISRSIARTHTPLSRLATTSRMNQNDIRTLREGRAARPLNHHLQFVSPFVGRSAPSYRSRLYSVEATVPDLRHVLSGRTHCVHSADAVCCDGTSSPWRRSFPPRRRFSSTSVLSHPERAAIALEDTANK